VQHLTGSQKKYLKGLAHGLKAVVFVGQKGMTPEVAVAVDEALNKHELIKLKFVDFKEKGQKEEITAAIARETDSAPVGLIGHTAIFYRRQKEPEKRKITLPEA